MTIQQFDNQQPIGIIGAMNQEVALLREQMQECQPMSLGGMQFYTGMLNGVPVVLQQCGIGKVNAAIGTTLMIDRFNPRGIINTGSAGGLDPELNVGDVIISTEVRHHDVDVTAFGYEHGQVPQLPAAFRPCDDLVESALGALNKMNNEHQIEQGLIITGDSFMQCGQRVSEARDKFPASRAAEMEAAAIAQVCHQMETPFLIIRSLSDIAGKESNVSFEQFLETAATHSAEMVMAIIAEIGDDAPLPLVA